MKIRFVSGLAAGAVLLISGAALSGGVVTNSATLVNYDQTTSELWALPSGQPLASYLNQQFTSYLAADLTAYAPPDPCLPPAAAWNFTVAYDQRHHTHSTFIYNVLLTVQADLGCGAKVTALTSGSPQPLLAITPSK